MQDRLSETDSKLCRQKVDSRDWQLWATADIVAVEESQQDLRSLWWLWRLRPLLCEAASARICRGYGYASRLGSYAAVTVPTRMHPFTLRTTYVQAVTALSRVSDGIPQATAALSLGGSLHPSRARHRASLCGSFSG